MGILTTIDEIYEARRIAGTDEICQPDPRYPWPVTICTPLISPWYLQRYLEVLDILKPFMEYIDREHDWLVQPLIDKYYLPATPRDKTEALIEVGRTIISRTEIRGYESGNYMGGTSKFLTNMLREDFEFAWPGPPRLRWWFIDALHYDEYHYGVQLDLLISKVQQAIHSPPIVAINWEAHQREWWEEKLSDIFDYMGGVYAAIFDAMWGSVWQFIASVILFYYVIGPAMMDALVMDGTITYGFYGNTVVTMGEVYVSGELFIEALSTYFGTFLATIHYDTLIGVHTIAYLVSQDYREMMNEVYTQISLLSTSLGYAPQFLALFLRNTRTLVLDASTRMGMRYDMAEVQWLGTLEEYSQILAARAHRYRDNPEALFFDMGELIERPIADSAGIFSQTIITTVNNTLTALNLVVTDVTTVTDNLAQLIQDLPENIRAQIGPVVNPIIQQVDDFIRDTYTPALATVTTLVDTISTMQGVVRGDVNDIVDRLKRPGTLLLGIDALDDPDRVVEENALSEVTSRGHTRSLTEYQGVTDADLQSWGQETERIVVAPPLPQWDIPEAGQPAGVLITHIETGKTWFVGDF